jgi:hypothetical protein
MWIERTRLAVLAAAVAATILQPPLAWSQASPPQQPPAVVRGSSSGQPLSDGQLDQLLAPIALYPDPLLAQILMASTYPLEVVEANRWLQDPAHAALKGDALVAALQSEDWDPSVKALVPFPRVVQMMDSRLDWMSGVGDAFLAQQGAVMDSVQRLRQRAEAAGTLQSTPHETVANDGQVVTVEPADPSYVYVPVYSPTVVYGPWPWPEYPPFWFPPPIGYDFYGEPILWWDVPIIVPLWGWSGWHWHDHEIWTNPGRFHGGWSGHRGPGQGAWQHDPTHRRGVPYRNAAVIQRFAPERAAAPSVPRTYRGFSSEPAHPGAAASPHPGPAASPHPGPAASPHPGTAASPHPAAPHAGPPLFDSYGAGREVRGDAARGRQSQMSMPSRGSAPGHQSGKPR